MIIYFVNNCIIKDAAQAGIELTTQIYEADAKTHNHTHMLQLTFAATAVELIFEWCRQPCEKLSCSSNSLAYCRDELKNSSALRRRFLFARSCVQCTLLLT